MAIRMYHDFVLAAGDDKEDIRGFTVSLSTWSARTFLFLIRDLGTGAVQALTRIRAIGMARGGLVAPLLFPDYLSNAAPRPRVLSMRSGTGGLAAA
jgi:hypothetical protein